MCVRKTTELDRNKTRELNTWTEAPCSWVECLNTAEVSVLSTLIYRSKAVPGKISTSSILSIYKSLPQGLANYFYQGSGINSTS